ncbi:helix-turn-helix transcriptional regulator [Saccharopolyspora phatthalungensis]|uniref:Non-specific serine/threonine protein kinase n=1 Tax=Saccharopolyspora phatthalungensis TaxID=664693 RepID=A0A840QF34_9PSEU|nr:LuxR C-terminal-related transcriptional regulator [Saccharopolyspora phatthalungensis]MBB5157095.1 non-specific serine/threonine protein kinase [Saccharopolyspora phatthalungensis]
MLAEVPNLFVLATSREPLAISGEYVWPVPPLAVPPDDAGPELPAGPYDALALFEERAAAILPGFTLNKDNEQAVARLCRRLDGLPLAIELAVVRMRALSVDQILDRLQDRFALLAAGSRTAEQRHQTLRGAVEWSFDLCLEPERLLWARCSVFAGDFDLAAAENVCAGAGLSASDVLNAVFGLVDKSILTREENALGARYRVLETIRQYGQERLDEAGETLALCRRHRDYYLHLAEQADANSCGPGQYEWAERLRVERANLRKALDYCFVVPGEGREGLRLASALWFYWIACGFVREGHYWLDRVLKADQEASRERARALWIDSWASVLQGRTSDARALGRECYDLAQLLGDPGALAHALQRIGEIELFSNNLPRAVQLLDEAFTRFSDWDSWTAPALFFFPQRIIAAGILGDTEGALALDKEGEAVCARLGERWARSWTRWTLGLARWLAGEHQIARALLRESLQQKLDLGDQLGVPFCVELLAWVAIAEDDPKRAAVLFGAAEKLWKPIGTPLFGFQALLTQREHNRAAARAALGDQDYEALLRAGSEMTPEALAAQALGVKPTGSTGASPASQPTLTKREHEVAALMARGLQNKEIAVKLLISQRTVEAHVEHILTKLGFTSRTQIAAWMAGETSEQI